MSGRWIAGSIRAQLLVSERTVGHDVARTLATAPSLGDALALLARTPYRRGIRHDLSVQTAQRAVAATALLNLRVLAGWLPGDALPPLRALTSWFELCNLEDRIAYLTGGESRAPFELGALATVWDRAAATQSLDALRRVVAASAWGDPDGLSAAELGLGLRLAWVRRLCRAVPEAQHWASAAGALLLARELFLVGTPVELLQLPRLDVFGTGWTSARSYERLVDSLPPEASWVFAAAPSAGELWRAEARWWRAVESGANIMAGASPAGRRKVVAEAVLLAVDAHRVRAALAAAARNGLEGAEEAFDAAA